MGGGRRGMTKLHMRFNDTVKSTRPTTSDDREWRMRRRRQRRRRRGHSAIGEDALTPQRRTSACLGIDWLCVSVQWWEERARGGTSEPKSRKNKKRGPFPLRRRRAAAGAAHFKN